MDIKELFYVEGAIFIHPATILKFLCHPIRSRSQITLRNYSEYFNHPPTLEMILLINYLSKFSNSYASSVHLATLTP